MVRGLGMVGDGLVWWSRWKVVVPRAVRLVHRRTEPQRVDMKKIGSDTENGSGAGGACALPDQGKEEDREQGQAVAAVQCQWRP